MLVNMDVININNNGSSGHFDVVNVAEETPSVIANGTKKSGKFENQMSEGDRAGRKRKTRRFKSRYKGKLSSKSKYCISKKMRTRAYPQSEAPNNTNEFLMEEHTIEDLDDSLANKNLERSNNSRQRESSFTSVDSDDEQFYSSPEDEDEFLSKDFDNTYKSMCAEKFGNLSKAQLTKIIFELEAKVEELNKRIVTNSKLEEMSMLMQLNGLDSKEVKLEMKDVLTENERLKRENEELKQLVRRRDSSTSTSSSSSGQSESDESDAPEGHGRTENEKNVIDQKAS